MSTVKQFESNLQARHRWGKVFEMFCLAATLFGLIVLAILLISILIKSHGWLDGDFLSNYTSRKPAEAGVKASIWGSFWLVLLTALFSIPVGIGAAIYLEEYSGKNRLTSFIQLNLSNLAGVPSIVYGILGLSVFVRMFGAFPMQEHNALEVSLIFTTLSIPLPFGPTIISGALTLSLLILPVVIISSQEALRSVPPSLRHAALALGATEWQTIRQQVLPASLPGIATGIILALSRAMGETAPLLMVGAVSYIASTPGGIESFGDLISNPGSLFQVPFDRFTCLPMQVYDWVAMAKPEFQHVAAAGIVVLLVVLLLMNAIAVFIRQKYRGMIQW